MALAYPLINGVVHDPSSLDVKVDGISYFRTKSLDFNDGIEPADVYALGSQKIGRTRGQYSSAGGIEFYEAESVAFEQQLIAGATQKGYPPGVGLYEIAFTVTVFYQAEGPQSAWQVDMVGCRITKRTPSGLAAGNEALASKYDLNVSYIIKNGVAPLTGLRK
jgi:hypothetical protein